MIARHGIELRIMDNNTLAIALILTLIIISYSTLLAMPLRRKFMAYNLENVHFCRAVNVKKNQFSWIIKLTCHFNLTRRPAVVNFKSVFGSHTTLAFWIHQHHGFLSIKHQQSTVFLEEVTLNGPRWTFGLQPELRNSFINGQTVTDWALHFSWRPPLSLFTHLPKRAFVSADIVQPIR